MKILMISNHFNLSEDTVPIGGVQKHISEVSDILFKNHEVTWQYPYQRRPDYDLIVFHDFTTYDFNAPSPRIIVFHGWEGKYPVDPDIKDKRQRIANHADYVIQVGDFIKRLYDTHADKTIYGGVNITLIKETPKSDAVFVGRLEPDNCPEEALKYAYLREWNLTVLGNGTQREKLEALYPKFNFKGFVSDSTSYMAHSNHIIIGGYLSMLEGMLLKKPIYGFYGNSIGRKIYLESVPMKINISPTAENMVTIANDDYNLEKNHEWAKNQTWQNIAEIYEEAYQKIKL